MVIDILLRKIIRGNYASLIFMLIFCLPAYGMIVSNSLLQIDYGDKYRDAGKDFNVIGNSFWVSWAVIIIPFLSAIFFSLFAHIWIFFVFIDKKYICPMQREKFFSVLHPYALPIYHYHLPLYPIFHENIFNHLMYFNHLSYLLTINTAPVNQTGVFYENLY